MPAYELIVQLKRDGEAVDGYPTHRRIEVDEAATFDHEEATGGGFVTLPTGELDEINFLALRVDRQVTVRLDGQTDAGIVLNAGGALFIIDADIDAGASTNVTLSNASGNIVNVKGFCGGT